MEEAGLYDQPSHQALPLYSLPLVETVEAGHLGPLHHRQVQHSRSQKSARGAEHALAGAGPAPDARLDGGLCPPHEYVADYADGGHVCVRCGLVAPDGQLMLHTNTELGGGGLAAEEDWLSRPINPRSFSTICFSSSAAEERSGVSEQRKDVSPEIFEPQKCWQGFGKD